MLKGVGGELRGLMPVSGLLLDQRRRTNVLNRRVGAVTRGIN